MTEIFHLETMYSLMKVLLKFKSLCILNKKSSKGFQRRSIETFAQKNLSDRSKRQMTVYNVLNILGDRMQKNPSATITLVGSSNNSNSDGLTMAESVKTYLVNTFAINASRITTKVKTNPIYHLNNQEERKN
jgi:hypothetical protein